MSNKEFYRGILHPATGYAAVTPSDTDDLPRPARSFYVSADGNAYLDSADGETNVPFLGLLAGSVLPVGAVRVRSTNTTATLVALF